MLDAYSKFEPLKTISLAEILERVGVGSIEIAGADSVDGEANDPIVWVRKHSYCLR